MLFLIRSYYSTSFFTLNGFNPFLITRGIPITAFLHCYKISRSSSSYRIVYINFSHLSCLLYSIIRSTCAFVLHLHFCIVFSSRNSSIIFSFFLDRVDASNFILYRMNCISKILGRISSTVQILFAINFIESQWSENLS